MRQNIIKIIFTVSFLALLNACGGGGSDSSSGVDRSGACGVIGLQQRIINGNTCSAEAPAVVRVAAVLAVDGDIITFPICTGTMISSNDVLTAQHCFQSSEIDGFPVLGYGIIFGEVGSSTFIAAAGISHAPNYIFTNDRLFNDASVIHLNSSPGLPIIGILVSSAPQIGDTGYVYGYGRRSEGTELNSSLDFSTLEAGAMRIENVTGDHIFVVYTGSGTNVCNGDSGGPIIVDVGGTPAIVGVVSQGTTVGCVPDDITSFANTQNPGILSWLTTVVPDAAIL